MFSNALLCQDYIAMILLSLNMYAFLTFLSLSCRTL